jgi:hypothetical protein
MIALFCLCLALFASPFRSKGRLEAENAALRHQLIILRGSVRLRCQCGPNPSNRGWSCCDNLARARCGRRSPSHAAQVKTLRLTFVSEEEPAFFTRHLTGAFFHGGVPNQAASATSSPRSAATDSACRCEGCGCKGGPGWRGQNGQCVSHANLTKDCGSPPSTRCTHEGAR